MTEYVGFDVSKEETAFCVKGAEGEVIARGKVATEPEALLAALKEHCLRIAAPSWFSSRRP